MTPRNYVTLQCGQRSRWLQGGVLWPTTGDGEGAAPEKTHKSDIGACAEDQLTHNIFVCSKAKGVLQELAATKIQPAGRAVKREKSKV